MKVIEADIERTITALRFPVAAGTFAVFFPIVGMGYLFSSESQPLWVELYLVISILAGAALYKSVIIYEQKRLRTVNRKGGMIILEDNRIGLRREYLTKYRRRLFFLSFMTLDKSNEHEQYVWLERDKVRSISIITLTEDPYNYLQVKADNISVELVTYLFDEKSLVNWLSAQEHWRDIISTETLKRITNLP
jgi:hypothetical protein